MEKMSFLFNKSITFLIFDIKSQKFNWTYSRYSTLKKYRGFLWSLKKRYLFRKMKIRILSTQHIDHYDSNGKSKFSWKYIAYKLWCLGLESWKYRRQMSAWKAERRNVLSARAAFPSRQERGYALLYTAFNSTQNF